MRKSLVSLVLCLVALAATACRSATTVYLVRHAERTETAGDRDPPLSPAGAERARALAALLADTDLADVYVTQFQRTRQTGAPTADAHRVAPRVFTVGKDVKAHAKEVADDLIARHFGHTVLVVGHSDTVPLLVEALGGPETTIAPTEFNRLFVLTRRPDGRVDLVDTRYGK